MHTNEQIKTKFKAVKKTLKAAHLRATWFQDYTNAHTITNALQMVEQLENEFDIKFDPPCGMSHK
ncbi:MAG: hypothetical protein CMD98_06975 [Gammaproteobacteria bacterium]|nr:hypothetical protein [Gammaproteobacteria bacterium]|tara:strand:+ start:54890 stop:55084 length:195 start_codon:yes stop_codon:yes gene_type:complete